eukprot:1059792-Rhodomonas_salina.2
MKVKFRGTTIKTADRDSMLSAIQSDQLRVGMYTNFPLYRQRVIKKRQRRTRTTGQDVGKVRMCLLCSQHGTTRTLPSLRPVLNPLLTSLSTMTFSLTQGNFDQNALRQMSVPTTIPATHGRPASDENARAAETRGTGGKWASGW